MDVTSSITDPCPNSLSGVSANLFLTLINTLMATKCQIHSPLNYPPDYGPKLVEGEEFDFIIIGGGTSGSAVANKLTENPDWKVLVLEAGDLPSFDTELPSLLFSVQEGPDDWQYLTEAGSNGCLGFKDGKCRWPRGKCLGGSSSINANLYVRGNKKDYDQWAELGNDGWDYDSIFKYFKELEDLQVEELSNSTLFGRGGPLPLSLYHSNEPLVEALKQSAQLLGYSVIPQGDDNKLGFFEAVQTVENGVRANAGKALLGKIKDWVNLAVALNSRVEKILVEGSKAESVQVNVGGRKLKLKARKEIVLSAGAINSPQILMLSGIGPKNHLENLGIQVVRNLAVGQNLQDHIFFVGLYMSLDDSAVNFKSNPIHDLYQYFLAREGRVGQISVTNFVGFINTLNDTTWPNMQFHHILFEKNDNYLLPIVMKVMGMTDEIASLEIAHNRQSPTLNIVPTLLHPKSRGEIHLRSNDPLDKPLIYPKYLQDQDEVETMLQGVKFALRQLETPPVKKFNPKLIDLKITACRSFEFNSDDYWRCAIKSLTTTVYHPVGTCKMGPSTDPGAVVDSRLKVRGIENLRVIDASIMPVITSANTVAPSLMIGRKGGTMISEDWTSHVHGEL